MEPLGSAKFLGFYYAVNGTTYLIASDGLNSTWAYNGTSWSPHHSHHLGHRDDAVRQQGVDDLPCRRSWTRGYWTPSGGFVADADMPHGDTIIGFKSRLWVSP